MLGDRRDRTAASERGIGYVPKTRPVRTMTVYNHLAFALILRWKRAAIDKRVWELAGWLGIESILNRKRVD